MTVYVAACFRTWRPPTTPLKLESILLSFVSNMSKAVVQAKTKLKTPLEVLVVRLLPIHTYVAVICNHMCRPSENKASILPGFFARASFRKAACPGHCNQSIGSCSLMSNKRFLSNTG